MTMKILVGVDGSKQSQRAVEWCASHANALGAEVVVVHAIDMPVLVSPMITAIPTPQFNQPDRDALREIVTNEWCEPLHAASVPFRVVLTDGQAALSIMQAAKTEAADLVVTGRRGRGGFAELVLGSTTQVLTHHLARPLLIVP